MSNRAFRQVVLCVVAILLVTSPASAVDAIKTSSYGAGVQIWFEVEDYDERDPDDDSGFEVRDEPGAFGQAIETMSGSDGAHMIRYTFDISDAGGTGGTWYFWGRVINPGNDSSFMLVEGDPGDASQFPIVLPTGNIGNSLRIFENSAGGPGDWIWEDDNKASSHTKTLQDGVNTMYVLTRESEALWDVFMWTDDPDYEPTDEDYINAKAPVAGVASRPSPSGVDVLRDSILSWEPGDFAATHNLYFGDTFDDVNSAIVASAEGLDVNSFDPGRLEFGKTYYWRVDEVNGTPDKTVFRGDVWSFEAEPYSILIPGSSILVTASSSTNELSTPERTIDGSGLGADESHTITAEDMWFSDMPDLDPWIQYEFDGVKKLDVMKVWNSNSGAESGVGWGVKDVQIEYSVDGTTWEVLADANQLSQAPGSMDYNQYDAIDFAGAAAKYVRLAIQNNWGGVLMSYSLSEVQFSMIPVAARSPMPDAGSVGVLVNEVLTWRAGREADQHTVYVSADPNEVADGLAPSVTSSTDSIALSAFDLQMGETYYWRVDEVNEAEAVSVWSGPVWNLSLVDAVTVDDFEAYGNASPDRPFQTWLDGIGYSADEFFPVEYVGNGTGAAIGHDIWSLSSPHYDGQIMESGLAAAGSGQSMPFYYSNSGGEASQTDRTFSVPQDWTLGSALTLSIAFRGQAGNTGSLFAEINGTKVTYPLDAGNIAIGAWQVWNVDLAQIGGDLSNVSTMSIGVDGAGASGMILIDDMKLYAQPGELITPVAPDPAGLLAQYSFEGNANDSSGSGLNGQLTGSEVGLPGAPNHGSGVQISPGGFVDLGNPSALDFSTGDWTVAAWFKTDMTGTGDANKGTILGKGGDSGGGHRYALIMSETSEGVVTLVTDDNSTKHVVNSVSVTNDDQWHYVVGQREGTEIRIYIDGQLEGSATADPAYDLAGTSQHNAYIGAITNNGSSSRYKLYNGAIDEVVIYDRALSPDEILYLAGRTNPIHKPF